MGAEEAAGGRRRRRRGRGTWGRIRPRLRWRLRLSDWTLSGTEGRTGTSEQGVKACKLQQ